MTIAGSRRIVNLIAQQKGGGKSVLAAALEFVEFEFCLFLYWVVNSIWTQ